MEPAVPEIHHESLTRMMSIIKALMFWIWTDVPAGEAYKYLSLFHELMLYSDEFCPEVPRTLTSGLETFTRIFCARSFFTDEPTFYFIPENKEAFHHKKLAIAFVEWRQILTEAGYPYPMPLRQVEAKGVLNYPYLMLMNLLYLRFKRWSNRLESDDSQTADWVRLTADLLAYQLAACEAGRPLEIKEAVRHKIYNVTCDWMHRGFIMKF
ncbi:MAG: hypothetical protein A2W35_20480 [Chloroflexi bacterium RBG_16_57_11]|nr:MAG: hypothetical protein A2W35_20480 [Chloroflexi bacterium RBG_16_57_11]